MFLYLRSGRRVWQAGIAPNRDLRVGDTFEAKVRLQHHSPTDEPVNRTLLVEVVVPDEQRMYATFS
jgi:hypothetical protein